MRKLIICFGVLILISCKKDSTPDELTPREPNLPATAYNYANPNLPAHFLNVQLTSIDNMPASNLTTDEGATLGRVLFYETQLSKNNTVSCASCHVQDKGFSDPFILSEGFDGHFTGRHSMGIVNSRYYPSGKFFWDERAATLEEQVLMPIQDSVEMGLTLTELVERVQGQSYYEPLFQGAFGSTEITTDKISKALAQYIRSIVSYQSKYDVGRAMVSGPQEEFPNYTPQENRGKVLFQNGPNGFACSMCHARDIQVANKGRNNGLDAATIDDGVGGVSGNPFDEATFKVPSLRNVMLRAPYMHDGRFATIEAVLEHYSTGIQDHPTLDHELRNTNTNQPIKLNMTAQEKQDLIAFFHTLSDSEITTDPKFSDPFKN
jgi:cytochrome c peroxidase